MRLRLGGHPSVRAALAASALAMLASACGGSREPAPVPSANIVGGTERLAWTQAGEVSALRFSAYVDNSPMALDAASCDGSAPEAACTSPLPPLSTGIHTIALAAIDTLSGLESERSAPITVQKVAATAIIAGVPLASSVSSPGSLRLETVVATSYGLAYAVNVVATGVKAPAQLAWAPDGRLFVAEADGRVRRVRPGENEDDGEPALDARSLPGSPPAGPLGLALHPDFARNRFICLSFLAPHSSERALLRVLRLREVGGTLGEPATLFEAPLTMADGLPLDAPRLAFGPDRLLYVALPPGVEFENEPAASTPHASMLRLRDDGRVALEVAPLRGVVAHPIGFDWHPRTGALWALFSGDGQAVLQPVTTTGASAAAEAERATLPATAGGGLTSGGLRFQRTPEGRLEPARAFLVVPENEALSIVSLAQPIRTENLLAGMFGRIGDVVAGDGGSLFLATRNGEGGRDVAGTTENLIVRLTPRAR